MLHFSSTTEGWKSGGDGPDNSNNYLLTSTYVLHKYKVLGFATMYILIRTKYKEAILMGSLVSPVPQVLYLHNYWHEIPNNNQMFFKIEIRKTSRLLQKDSSCAIMVLPAMEF